MKVSQPEGLRKADDVTLNAMAKRSGCEEHTPGNGWMPYRELTVKDTLRAAHCGRCGLSKVI